MASTDGVAAPSLGEVVLGAVNVAALKGMNDKRTKQQSGVVGLFGGDVCGACSSLLDCLVVPPREIF